MLEILKALFGLLGHCSKTTLVLDSSRSVEVTGGAAATGGVTVQGILVTDTSNGKTQWYEFVGVGLGVSIGLPIGGSFSDESFTSWGGVVIKGPSGFGKINFDDLTGPGHIFTVSAAALETSTKGIGLSFVTMGEIAGEAPLCSALSAFAGMMIASPGVGAMCYKGNWHKVDK